MKIILNFKNPDEFKQLERQAYNGTLDVSDFPPAEYFPNSARFTMLSSSMGFPKRKPPERKISCSDAIMKLSANMKNTVKFTRNIRETFSGQALSFQKSTRQKAFMKSLFLPVPLLD